MCQKCKDDDFEYTHLSDLAIMLTETFQANDGEDLPVILDDNAGDSYSKITNVEKRDEESVYRLHFDYGARYYNR